MDEVKQKLNAEVTKITKEEVKGLKRVCACEYYEVAHELVDTLLLNQLERDVAPNSQEMACLVNSVIGGHFILFNDGSELEEGEMLSELACDINKRINAHLTTLPFAVNTDEQARGTTQDGIDAFSAYCQASYMTDYQHYEKLVEPLIKQGDQATINKCALLYFEQMEALIKKLWSNIDKKKEKAKKGAKIKEFWVSTKCIDSSNKKLGSAMEVDDEDATTVNNIIDKRVDKRHPKQKPKGKKRSKQTLSATGKTNRRGPQKLVGMA